jgi:hypothetical protein
LKGFRLVGDDFVPIEADKEGRLNSDELGIWLRVEDSSLALYDRATGERLLTANEAEIVAAEVAEAAKAAAEAAEEEIRRLREELRRHGLAE